MGLAWVVVVGVIGIVIYAEMAGRVAAMSGRPVFDVIRERLGARAGLVNLGASFFINLLTLTAEIAGLALVIELATAINYLLWIPLVAVAVWLVIWKVRFSVLEKVFGLSGLLLVVIPVALWQLDAGGDAVDAGDAPVDPVERVARDLRVLRHRPARSGHDPVRGVLLLVRRRRGRIGRAGPQREPRERVLGFPLGGALSSPSWRRTAIVLTPRGISVDTLVAGHAPRGHRRSVKLGWCSCCSGSSRRYSALPSRPPCRPATRCRQFFGWQWGKFVRPREAARFHVVILASIAVSVAARAHHVDPVKVTEYSIVLSAAALPLTYFPILVVANDPAYVGEATNGRILNALATLYLVILLVVSVATIPLIIITKGGG